VTVGTSNLECCGYHTSRVYCCDDTWSATSQWDSLPFSSILCDTHNNLTLYVAF
jgi:hypothetical protein